MIASVSGRVAAIGPGTAVVEVGGFGVSVVCTPATLAGLRVGEQIVLATSLVVREDSLTLFGFADEDARVVFEQVQTVTGIGPRLAQGMLAVHEPDALRRAVASDDLVALMAVPGIGRKGAQRLVLELKDRLGPPRGGADLRSVHRGGGRAGAGWDGQVHAALLGLGWPVRDADEAVAAIAPMATEEPAPDVGALLRAALQTLSRV